MPKKTDDKVVEKVKGAILRLAKRKAGVTPQEVDALPGSPYLKGKVFGDLKKTAQLVAKRCNPKDARKVSYHETAAA